MYVPISTDMQTIPINQLSISEVPDPVKRMKKTQQFNQNVKAAMAQHNKFMTITGSNIKDHSHHNSIATLPTQQIITKGMKGKHLKSQTNNIDLKSVSFRAGDTTVTTDNKIGNKTSSIFQPVIIQTKNIVENSSTTERSVINYEPEGGLDP